MTTPMHTGLETVDKNCPYILLYVSITNMSGQECVCLDNVNVISSLVCVALKKYWGFVVTGVVHLILQ